MRSTKARLAVFVAGLAVLGAAMLLLAPVGASGLRDTLKPFGVGAPVAFVVVSGVLGSLFIPGPILAGASGLLFGAATGFFATLGATVVSTVIAVLSARAAGRPGVQELGDPRVLAIERLLGHRPVLAVAVQRLLPAVPDAPFSYLFGLTGLPLGAVVLGTIIGAAPRAFAYTAIGDGLGGGGSTIATVGLVTLVAGAVLGAAIGAVLLRRARS